MRDSNERAPCSYSNDHLQLFSSCQKYRAAILKGSCTEASLTGRASPPQEWTDGYSEAKPICIWIKGVQRQLCIVVHYVIDSKWLTASMNRNAGTLCTFPVRMSQISSERSHLLQEGRKKTKRTFLMFCFLFFFLLEVLQDNMITAQCLKEEKCTGIATKWNQTDAIEPLLNRGSLQKAVLFSPLRSTFLQLFLSVCHFLFSSPPFPVVSTLAIPTCLTLLSLRFSAHSGLLFLKVNTAKVHDRKWSSAPSLL